MSAVVQYSKCSHWLYGNFSCVSQDLDDREGVMHRIRKRMRELQRSLRSKDDALSDKNNELQQALQEIQR